MVQQKLKNFTLFFLLFALIGVAAAEDLVLEKVSVYGNNEAGFTAKYNLISGAQQTIDMVYFIIEDDYSSSLLFKNVIDKIVASRKPGATPLKVRILVDYFMSDGQLAFLRFLQSYPEITIKRFGAPSEAWLKEMTRLGIDRGLFVSGLMGQKPELIEKSLPVSLGKFKALLSADMTSQTFSKKQWLVRIMAAAKAAEAVAPEFFWGLMEFLYRTHHKLLVVDGSQFQMGGRNLADEYHALKGTYLIDGSGDQLIEGTKIAPKTYAFSDMDVATALKNPTGYETSPVIQSFVRLWMNPRNVDMSNRLTETEKDPSIWTYEDLSKKAKLAEFLLKTDKPNFEMENKGGINARYVENVMNLHSISKAEITQEYTNLLESLEAGDTASIANAYFYQDPTVITGEEDKDISFGNLYRAFLHAGKSGADVTVHTNSIKSTDLSVVNVLSYPFYDNLIKAGIKLAEYSAGQGSLHKKTAYFKRPKKNDVLVVGSYNLDARSHYKDTNNALSIDVPAEQADASFAAFNTAIDFDNKWDAVDDKRLGEIEEINKDEKNQKTRAFLLPFRPEI